MNTHQGSETDGKLWDALIKDIVYSKILINLTVLIIEKIHTNTCSNHNLKQGKNYETNKLDLVL